MNKWNDYNFVEYLDDKKYGIHNLPKGTKISTACASLKLGVKLNIPNIDKYLLLNSDDILAVNKIRTLLKIKKKNKNVNNDAKPSFYNQITVIVRLDHGETDNIDDVPKINMKLFKNGSIQMSGCKSVTGINIALNKLIFRLKEVKGKMENGNIVDKPFIEDIENLNVNSFKIDMINSNYKINMQVDRDKLYNLLLKKKIKSSYEPCIRACVIIKYTPDKDNIDLKEVSIFIFQKGNIIITGAKSSSHIISSYEYINEILYTHIDDIIRKDEQKEEELLLKLYDDVMKEVDYGLIKLNT